MCFASSDIVSQMIASATISSGLVGLVDFCELIGEPLAPFQRRIARAYFGKAREIAAVLPRGNSKTSTAALIAVHHLLSTPGASVTIGAASRDQARIAFERMRGFAQDPAVEDHLIVRHLELRNPEGDVLREAAHSLERDPRLIAGGRADRDRRTRRGEQVMDGDQCRRRRLRVASRQDRRYLPGRPEVGPCDPALERCKWLVDRGAEVDEAGETWPRDSGCRHNDLLYVCVT